jgi:SAM-dependent methyltransferase
MSHKQQVDYCIKVKSLFPKYFRRKNVLDIGSMDINGSNRYLFTRCRYVGIDIALGKNVHYVSLGHEFKYYPDYWDVIISTEVAEHDKYWRLTMMNIIRLLKPGGLLLFTCATTGRPEHGTTRTESFSSPFTTDYYGNLTEEMIRSVKGFEENFSFFKFSTDTTSKDLQLFAFKKGEDIRFTPSILVLIFTRLRWFYHLRIRDFKSLLLRNFKIKL